MRSGPLLGAGILIVTLVACVPLSAQLASLQPVTADAVPCPAARLEIRDYVEGEPGGPPSTWTASGCGRAWHCTMKHGRSGETPFVLEGCEERPAP